MLLKNVNVFFNLILLLNAKCLLKVYLHLSKLKYIAKNLSKYKPLTLTQKNVIK